MPTKLYWSLVTVFAGKDASRALAQSSLKKEECRPEWEDLKPEHIKVLDDWFTFFSKRYNIKGKVATGNANLWYVHDSWWYPNMKTHSI
jgi:membrane-associated progesterone receptor component